MAFRFSWDRRKAEANLKKHGVSFTEAASVFYDSFAVSHADGKHSFDEARFLTFGMSSRNRVLVVAHSEDQRGIRIISARCLSSKERRVYEQEV